MKSNIVCIRLTQEELEWLDRYVNSANGGYESRSEWFRRHLHHEHDKRCHATTKAKDYQSIFRIGRPKEHKV